MANRQADIIKEMQDKEVLFHLYVTQLLIIILASVLGFFLFEDFASFLELWQWDMKEILIYGGGSALIVIAIDVFLMKILPKHMYDDGGVNEKVFKNRSVVHIVLISAVVAVSEELFFRGVIQTHFGYLVASIVFAVLHVRYLYKWALFIVVVSLSFFIGWIYIITANLLVTIFMHFLIDLIFAFMIRFKFFNGKLY